MCLAGVLSSSAPHATTETNDACAGVAGLVAARGVLLLLVLLLLWVWV